MEMSVPVRLPIGTTTLVMPEQSILRHWIQQAKAGDTAAFEKILRSHERLVLRTAQRMLANNEDAKDAAQEVFLRLHKNLAKIREDGELIPWLYRMTVNISLDLWRRHKRSGVTAGEVPEPADPGLNPEESLARAQRAKLLAEALEELPPKERAALVLRDLEDCSTAEVAGILRSSEATVRSQISTARVKIKKFMDDRLGERK